MLSEDVLERGAASGEVCVEPRLLAEDGDELEWREHLESLGSGCR